MKAPHGAFFLSQSLLKAFDTFTISNRHAARPISFFKLCRNVLAPTIKDSADFDGKSGAVINQAEERRLFAFALLSVLH